MIVGHARIVVFSVLSAVGMAGAAAQAQERIDRTIVSPFEGDRRIVVQPGPDGGSQVVAVGAAFDAPVAVAAPPLAPVSIAPVPPAAAFIDIGPLDAPPASVPVPEFPVRAGDYSGAGYLDTGPYREGVLSAPSSFPPD